MSVLREIVKSVLPNDVIRRVKAKRLRQHLQAFDSYEVTRIHAGTERTLWIADGLGQGWYDVDMPPLPEIELLRAGKLRHGAVVFDLGAHQSVVAMMLADAVGSTGRVISVEGCVHNVEIGKRNVTLNQLESNIEVIQAVAAREHSGKIAFAVDGQGKVDLDGRSQLMSTVSIDGLASEYSVPDVLFVDVEGYECEVLAGASETLKSNPDVFVEVHVNHGLEENGSVQQLIGFFDPAIYELHISPAVAAEFHPYRADSSVIRDRFFLVALSKQA